MRDAHNICKAAIGSATHAQRAAEILLRAAIRAEVVKLSSGRKDGCIYGIELPCAQKRNAIEVLSRQRIPIRSWTDESSGKG